MATKEQIEAVVKKAQELGYSNDEINTELKAKGFIAPSLNPIYTTNDTKGNFLSNLVGSTALGQKIGGMIYGQSQGYKNLKEVQKRSSEIEQNLVQTIDKYKKLGRDTSRLEKALNDLQTSNVQINQAVQELPTGGVTNRQVLGSAIQTAASAIPFASALSKVGTAAKTGLGAKIAGPGLNTVSRIAKGPISGAALEGSLGGAMYNLGQSVGEGQSAYDTAVNTTLGGVVGAAGGAALAGVSKLAGKALGGKPIRDAQTVAGDLLDKTDKLLGNDANLKSAVLNKELFGVDGDITKAPRITAFSDLVENLKGRKVLSLEKNRKPKEIKSIKDTTIGDAYQVVEQRMREIYKEIDDALTKAGDGFEKQPIIDFINSKAKDVTTSPTALRKLGFRIDKKGNLSIAPRGLIARIIQSKNVKQIEKIITEELAPELQSMAKTGLNAPAKSTLAGLRQVLNETIDKQIASLGGEYSSLKQKYGAYRGIEDALKSLGTGYRPDLIDMIDNFGMSNIIGGAAFNNLAQFGKGTAFFGQNITKRILNSENVLLREILTSAEEFNKLKSVVTKEGGDLANEAINKLDLPPTIPPDGKVFKSGEIPSTIQGDKMTQLPQSPKKLSPVKYAYDSNVNVNNSNNITSLPKSKIDPKNFKTAEEYVRAHDLYHATNAELEGGKLSFGKGRGPKKGGQSGGLFLTDNLNVTKAFGEKVYQAPADIKQQVLDLTEPKNIKLIENQIGKQYTTFDGENVLFTRQDFEAMFPNGETDFASVSQYPELVEKVVKEQGKRGIAFNEFAAGEMGKTYQILEGDIPVKTRSQLIEEWNKANSQFSFIENLPPELQKKATEAIKTLQEIADSQKNNGIEGAAAFAPLAFLKDFFGKKKEPTQEPVQEEVSPVKMWKEEIAFRESRGEKDPYTAVNKNKDGTSDYGKYQVNEQTLKEWGERALGKKITPQEFLNSPEDQEKFVDYILNRFEKEYGVKDLDTALALWHKGWSPEHINNPDIAKKKARDYISKPKD